MPIYEYRCKKCLKIFEKILFSSEKDAPQTCPLCSNPETEKVMSKCTNRSSGSAGSFEDSSISSQAPAPSCSHAGGG